MNKQKLIVILGPTASGKSDLAVQIAKKFNGEIVSADSRQVYKGMDIGTGKITEAEMQGIPHHMLDVCPPGKVFTVAQYRKFADKKIQIIFNNGKQPIICGGTGFYIDALVSGQTFPEVLANGKLRKELDTKTLEELQNMLRDLDLARFKTVDTKNKVRLIRAIEIATEIGSTPKIKTENKYDVLYIGINWPKDVLRERIYSRIISRIDTGMIEEIERLHTEGLSWKRMFSLGLEYRYISLFLKGKYDKEEMIKTLHTKICQFAKRQMTWFKRNKKIIWLEPTELTKADEEVKKFLN